MAKPGPKPTPKEILALRGSRRGERTGNEPTVDHSPPQAPTWLDGDARQVWDQLIPMLERSGVLATIDEFALSRYCDQWVRWRRAADFLKQRGDTHSIKDRHGEVKGLRQWPQVRIARDLAAALSRIEAEYGMTPSSRSRIIVGPSATPRAAILDFLADA